MQALPINDRDKQLLSLLALGKSNKEIAAVLDTSTGSICYHLRNLYHKLQTTTRGEALRKAVQQGYVQTTLPLYTPAEGERVCKTCLHSRPLEAFVVEARCKEGRTHQCLACRREYERSYQEKNRAHKTAKRRAYRQTHPDKRRAAEKRRYWRHCERFREKSRKYYYTHRERLLAKQRTDYHSHRERMCAKQRDRYAALAALKLQQKQQQRAPASPARSSD